MNETCHITGTTDEAANMLRFVRAPDGRLTPDLAGKLPGSALWTGNRRALVEKLARDERARRGTGNEKADGLPVLVEKLMRRHLAQALGLARKAGKLITGFAKVEAALKAGELHMLITASDAGEDGKKKLRPKARAQNIPLLTDFSARELAMALGRENVIHAGLTDVGWARNLGFESRRLATYLGGEEQE